ncbi:hypothetical protein TIFTF001_016937 [Ficus carica]|uniref:Uncharacterized protein n=1 Tax=Ficus carica TaxID=3494 RepID=A0AA88DIX9_FICCA|nr:hypothetical protein TIFTF001_016937 [Ficus carica]
MSQPPLPGPVNSDEGSPIPNQICAPLASLTGQIRPPRNLAPHPPPAMKRLSPPEALEGDKPPTREPDNPRQRPATNIATPPMMTSPRPTDVQNEGPPPPPPKPFISEVDPSIPERVQTGSNPNLL